MAQKPAWSSSGRTGKLYKYKDLTFFACEGLIALYDERPEAIANDDTFEVLYPTEMMERSVAMGRMGRKLKKGDQTWQKQEGREYENVAVEMEECVKEARHMGDPSDPAVQAWWRKHRPGSKSRITLSAGRDAKGYPELPTDALDRGPDTGRRADAGNQIDTSAADAAHNRIHKKPKRKNRSGLILDV